MYIPTPAHQTYVFLMCIGFGFLLGIFYHLVRFIRKTFLPFKSAVLIQDILYCVISTFAVFCFLLCCNDGEIRLFVFGGFGAGLLVYYLTFGIFVSRFLDRISLSFKKIFYPFRRIFTRLSAKIENKRRKKEKNLKKTAN
ncbi:MAG: spore cortex biosynthesis protein YabQ [Clostridia bacterium]|nr:spore cortex biosynthesis protein YabQ [Clostridia bacterium]